MSVAWGWPSAHAQSTRLGASAPVPEPGLSHPTAPLRPRIDEAASPVDDSVQADESAPTAIPISTLSIEDLAQVRVTSVSLAAEPLNGAAASTFVISEDDIRRSGATSLPEALRLAPNLHVARDDAIDWSITARGSGMFETANKLLVLIDGRSVYSPVFAGVFWDAQHRVLDDLDRIEVISGPGGTLYGANAVNGVINVISRDAFETQGVLAHVSAGEVDRTADFRWGGLLDNDGAVRLFVSGYERGESLFSASGDGAGDGYSGVHGGLRYDWRSGPNAITLQSDGHINEYDIGQRDTNANVVVRWRREANGLPATEVQAHWDQVDRDSPNAADVLNTYDVRAQINWDAFGNHSFVAGAGYRVQTDRFATKTQALALDPPRRRTEWSNVFVQDAIDLTPRLTLTLGAKAEHDSYTGDVQLLPNARLGWRLSPDHFVWGAVSRAVRAPNRFERDLSLGGVLAPNDQYVSEELIAYELGYRSLWRSNLSVSATAFYHDYDDLRSIGFDDDGAALRFRNDIEGARWGVEAWGRAQMTDWWRLSFGFFAMNDDFAVVPGGVDLSGRASPGFDPNYQVSIGSQFALSQNQELDLRLRHLDGIDEPLASTPSYTELDARWAWRLSDDTELYVAAFNLLDEGHVETRQPGMAVFENRRRISLGVRLRRS